MIYFARIGNQGIKIGHSRNVKARMKQLEAHYGKAMTLLATMEGGKAREKEIHDQFSHLRLGRTEQFDLGTDLLAFISMPLVVNPGEIHSVEPVHAYDMKPVQVFLTPEEQHMLRLLAAHNGKSMASYARDILLVAMKAEFKQRGLKL